ncbi:MAG: DUF362 domain-containing protein [wastewater metagenome]|nr:DUF362 domain-containing protein [Candidatus Loosdrechtia aerotolerans]
MKSRVSIAYDQDIEKSITSALDSLEDISDLFRGKHVAIKPNDTWASPGDLTPCTQADSVEAVIKYVKRFHPKKITITGGAGAEETDNVFRYLGIDKVIQQEGVEFFDHNRGPFQAVKLEYGPQKEVMINPYILEYDTVISLAQHKVHNSADVTLSMKNIAMSYPAADYYGHPRESYAHPHNFFKDLHGFIAGMCQRFPIDLGIIVGHPAMIGKGPIGGKTFESGITIAGKDPVATDYIGAKMLGRENARHIIEAEKLTLGVAAMENIEIAGISLDDAIEIFRKQSEK